MQLRSLLAAVSAALLAVSCGSTRATYHAPEAAARPPASLVAFHAADPITVDGKMDEATWRKTPPIRLRRSNGAPARLETDVRVAWDQHALYLFFHCVDRDIAATLDQHDAHLWQEDEVVEAFIDADNDGRKYIEIEVNPLNATFDAWISDASHISIPDVLQYEAKGMKTAVTVAGTLNDSGDTDEYWNCEIAMPWSDFHETLGLPPAPGTSWAMNFYRVDKSHGRSEYQAWNSTSGSFHQPWRFGEVLFLK